MSRIDRRTALRRAAAPSVDLSLMPDAGAIQALLEAANGTGQGAVAEKTPPPAPRIAPETVDLHLMEAPAHPGEERAPRTSLRHEATDEEIEAALAFVRAHRAKTRTRSSDYERSPRRVSQPPSARNAPTPAPSSMSTLIHFGRATGHFGRETTVDLDAQPERASAPTPARKASTTLKPRATIVPREEPALTLTPNAEEKRFWDGEIEATPERPMLVGEEDTTLGEEVDAELDAWMAKRGRGRVLTALGVAATMLLLLAAAGGGVVVMAQPGLLQASQPVEAPAPPPPPRPLRAR